MLAPHQPMLNKDSKKKKPILKDNFKKRKMKLMNLFQVIKRNLLNNLLRSNNFMIMKSNKLRSDLQILKIFMIKRCKIKLMSMKIESERCLTNMRITTMLLKKKKLPSKVTCRTSSLKSKKRMKLCINKLKTKTSISKNLKSHMLIFKIVHRTKVIQSVRNSLKKDEILMRKLKFYNLKSEKEKELFFNMRILKKDLEIRLRIRINNLKSLRENMQMIK